jgi:N-acetylmuramoyl-L-alanine amidase
LAACIGAPLKAQELRGVARLAPEGVRISAVGDGVQLSMGLTQAVPYRIETRLDPMRMIVEFREVDWSGFDSDEVELTGPIKGLASGRVREGWSFLALELSEPQTLSVVELDESDESGNVTLVLTTEAVSEADFLAAAVRKDGIDEEQLEVVLGKAPRGRQLGDRPLKVMLDPGHGGFDPGAENGDHTEAELMLLFVQDLQDEMVRVGGFEVAVTRDSDIFVPLPERVRQARTWGADVFVSIHADAIVSGRASGSTVYTLSDVASDEASARLAERLDRASLLAGADLSHQDDTVALALMDMARLETKPRSERLADELVRGIGQSVGKLHKRPRLHADFSVLRAPDIPSVLVELGFLSSDKDLENLLAPEWRIKAALGIIQGLRSWMISDAAEAELVRQ